MANLTAFTVGLAAFIDVEAAFAVRGQLVAASAGARIGFVRILAMMLAAAVAFRALVESCQGMEWGEWIS